MNLSDKLSSDEMCFACGSKNPISLQLNFNYYEDNKVKAEFKPHKNLQGFQDILHGGITSTVLDEAMAKVINMQGIKAVTAEINVRFKQAVPVEKEYVVQGILKKQKKKLIFTESFLKDKNDNLYASATAKFMEIGNNYKISYDVGCR